VGQGVTQAAAQLVCGVASLKAGGLVIGDVVGRLSGAMLLGHAIWRRDGSRMRPVRWQGMVQAARRFKHFPLVGSWSALCSNASLTLPPVLAAFYYGPSDAGLFSLAQRVIALPTIFVGQAISQVYFSEAAVLLRERPDGVSGLLRATVRRLFIFSAGPLILMAVFGPWGARVLLGPQWEQAGFYVRMLAPLYLGQFVVFPISETLNLLEHQRVQLAWDVVRLVTVVSIFAYGFRAGLSATSTTGIYAVAMMVLYGTLFVLADRAARRRQRPSTQVALQVS
jgi:O-antigen/teichoic acid export membrane protein